MEARVSRNDVKIAREIKYETNQLLPLRLGVLAGDNSNPEKNIRVQRRRGR